MKTYSSTSCTYTGKPLKHPHRSHRFLSPEQESQVLYLYSKNWSQTDLQRRFGLKSRGPIRNVLLRNNALREKEISLPSRELRRFAKLRTPVRQVARHFNVDPYVIWRLYDKLDLEKPSAVEVNRQIGVQRVAKREYCTEEFASYSVTCRAITAWVWRCYKFYLDPTRKLVDAENGEYALDHKVSVSFGFHNNLSPWIIAHPSNLEVVTRSENARKSTQCSVSLSQLRRSRTYWDKNLGNPYDCPLEWVTPTLQKLLESVPKPEEYKSWVNLYV